MYKHIKKVIYGLLFVICGACAENPPQHVLSKVAHGNGVLIIKYAEAWGYGPHTLYFYYQKKDADEEHFLGNTSLNNDGANLSDHNINVEAKTEDKIQFTLMGDQQEPEKWTLTTNNGSVLIKKQQL